MLTKKYQSQESAIATYDYYDIASGLGYRVFYGGNLADGSVSGAWVLADNTFYSNKITTFVLMTEEPQKYADMRFEVQLNAPRDMKGDLLVCVPVGVGRCTGDTGDIATINVSGAVYHFDGTTETNLGSFRSTNLVVADANPKTYNYQVLSNKVPIARTHFKPGDKLRVQIEGWSVMTGDHSRYMGIGHDPKNRPDPNVADKGLTIWDNVNTTYGPTDLQVHVPFILDI